ncbi:MAG: FG-GAP repeat domain-containing protein [Planctomycetota bacterium]|jgi:hypothetical protein
MSRRLALRLAVFPAVAGLWPGAATAADRFGTVTAIPVAENLLVQEATTTDLNEDGQPDLLIVAAPPRPRFARQLLIHLGQAGDAAFRPSPDWSLELTDDVVALATGDVHPDPGREIILFSARGAHAWRPGQERQKFVKLVDTEFLWQLPHPHQVVLWQDGIRDIDGDGWEDLLLPEPAGYRVALQRRAGAESVAFDPVTLLQLPHEVAADDDAAPSDLFLRRTQRRLEVGLNIRGGKARRPLLEVVESVPAPQLADWDADGDLDLLALTMHSLHVWAQDGGRFDEVHPGGFQSPVTVDRARRFDVSYSAHAADLNGDDRVDCVMFAGDQRAEEVRTQVLVFVQGAGRGEAAQPPEAPLFGRAGIPQQVLVIAGFAGAASLDDVDGDGRPDLVAMSFRPDLLDTIKGRDNIEVELYVYRNQGGLFSRQPDLKYVIRFPTKDLEDLGERMVASFFADVTGDGIREFVVRQRPTQVSVLLTRARDGALALAEDPLWQMVLDKDAQLRMTRHNDEAAPQLLALEKDQVLHVRFR